MQEFVVPLLAEVNENLDGILVDLAMTTSDACDALNAPAIATLEGMN